MPYAPCPIHYVRDKASKPPFVKFHEILSELWNSAHATPLICDLKLLNFINITEV